MVSPAQYHSIKVLVCDIDGVLTDGTIIYGDTQLELKAFNIKDGLGMRLAAWNDFPIVWLTGRTSAAVARRGEELGVQVFQGASNKDSGLRAIARERGITLQEIAYIGDDLNDIPALRLAGLPLAVADAVAEVRALAAVVTQATGGHGAIREVIEMILRGQGRWEAAVEVFLARSCAGHAGQ
jgi:3-deoxy-D-manno-octulosonate 8-phosphate phosphatase (KDO 8-P phosphatase)